MAPCGQGATKRDSIASGVHIRKSKLGRRGDERRGFFETDSASETKRCLGFKKGFHAEQTILVIARHAMPSPLSCKHIREIQTDTGAQRKQHAWILLKVTVGRVCLSIICSRVAHHKMSPTTRSRTGHGFAIVRCFARFVCPRWASFVYVPAPPPPPQP